MTLEVFSDSALVDRIKQDWRMCRTDKHHIPGDHYYSQIDLGILFNRKITVLKEHLSKDTQEMVSCITPSRLRPILLRAVLDIFAEKHGSSLSRTALQENRIHISYS